MALLDLFTSFWTELADRPEGPFAFRFLLQPLMSLLMALRDGRRDAREGRSPYFWHVAHADPAARRAALGEGFKATGRIMLLGVLIDVAYQFKVLGGFVRPLEAVVVALVLGFIPYLLLRGPVARLFRRFGHGGGG